uniref:DUF4939 domain-containing protein n=1 Tax=Xenopus tropicalis TaxID=8364 RepID=A0A803K182_XENTR
LVDFMLKNLLQRLREQETKQDQIVQCLQGLAVRLDTLQQQPPKIPFPEKFSGDRSKCFPQMYASERTKVGVTISLLSGEPKTWAHRLLETRSPLLNDSNAFFNFVWTGDI